MDGNNSLKRWNTSAYGVVPREDCHQPRSSYWLSNEEVNKFQYEVKATHVCNLAVSCKVTQLMPPWKFRYICRILILKFMMTIGKQANQRTSSTVLIAGEMLGQMFEKRHTWFSRSPVYLLQHVDTTSSSLPVT
ncbi:hypothetical protein JVT61DRAFT_6309 [Boletus reticuloceps]|uniref:Uncharacterized protein n=1 Tax=Boletus reticuloceps TaxID=495285 RepID=A0A8I2YKL2_9AGAM|nr:hypothetical protein JVT61DRAFT_6309 [Boletus reticuloceps]